MTDSKKLKILQEYIDKGLGEQVVLNVIDAFDREGTIREKVSIFNLFEKVSNKDNMNDYPNFKELAKAMEKNKPIYINGIFKDSFEKYIETIKNNKKIGSPDDAYNKEINQIN